ncbi:MAG: glutathione S-transferase [Polyangiales bacterium]
MAELTLTYFDFSGSRGEECRLALHAAGADFHDKRIKRDAWNEMKASTPFGGLPILEIEGKPALSETNAILTYVGRRYGLLPSDPWEAARHEAVLSAGESLRSAIGPLRKAKDEDEKKKTREEFISGYLKRWATNVDSQIEGPFVGGDALGVADIKLYISAHALSSGTFDYFPRDVLSPYKKFDALYKAVGEHAKIAEWRAMEH